MGDIVMSKKERHRLEVMSRVRDDEITLVKAQEWLRLSCRQTKRIWQRYCTEGDKGLVHLSRGRPSGRSKGAIMKTAVLERYRQVYTGFGPTLAIEHLANDGHLIDHETLQSWLIDAGLWERHRRRSHHRQRRERRPVSFGCGLRPPCFLKRHESHCCLCLRFVSFRVLVD